MVVLGRAFLTPLLGWPRFCYPTSSVALNFAPLKSCERASVVRPYYPGGAGTPDPKAQLQLSRVRRTGFSHRVGVSLVYLAPTLRFAPLQTPAIVATWHTKIRHLAYVLSPSSVLQSDQSSSRVSSESSPLPEQPGFSDACADGPRPSRCAAGHKQGSPSRTLRPQPFVSPLFTRVHRSLVLGTSPL